MLSCSSGSQVEFNTSSSLRARQDSERSEGSGAQESRREEHLQRLKDNVDRCERALELAKISTTGV